MKKRGRPVLLMTILAVVVAFGIAVFPAPAQAFYVYERYYTSDGSSSAYSGNWQAQTFTAASTHWINFIRLKLSRFNFPGTVTVSIRYTDAGGIHPSGADQVWGTTDGNTLNDGTADWREISMNNSFKVYKGHKYAIVVRAASGDATHYVNWSRQNAGGYAAGNNEYSSNSGTGWGSTSSDCTFDIRYDGSFALWLVASNVSADSTEYSAYADNWMAQTFNVVANESASEIDLKVYRSGLPGQVTVSVRATSGGLPVGDDLAVGFLDGNSLIPDSSGAWQRVHLSLVGQLRAGSRYAIVVRAPDGNASNRIYWKNSYPDSYAGGNTALSSSGGTFWDAYNSRDFLFKVYGMPTAFPAIFRQGGTWFIDYNRNGGYQPGTDLSFGPFGQQAGDKGLAVGWNALSSKCLTVFRNGTWFIDSNRSGSYNAGDYTNSPSTFGSTPGDVPLAVDYHKDGGQELAIFRQGGTWFIDANRNGRFDAGPDVMYNATFGKTPGDIPLFIDWNGSGTPAMAIFRPSTGMWYIDLNGNGHFDAEDSQFGPFGATAGDIPLAIDWDGDGLQELCIFRTTGIDKGKWYIDNNRNGRFDSGWDLSFGPFGSTAGDQPLAIWWTQ